MASTTTTEPATGNVAAQDEQKPKRGRAKSAGRGAARAKAGRGAAGLMSSSAAAPSMTASTLPVSAIDPDQWENPRGAVDIGGEPFEELRGSIRAIGILEPIVVGGPVLEDGRHGIIAGWRRFTAALAEGLDAVPVHIRADITDTRGALIAALAENLAREDMTPLAEAQAIAKLMELGETQEGAAKALGVSVRTARERLRLLKLPEPVQKAIGEGRVPTTAGRQLQVIADVVPDIASTIAEDLESGAIDVDDLRGREAGGLVEDVAREAGAPVIHVGGYYHIARLPIDKAAAKKLGARTKKASSYGGESLTIDVSDELLQAAKDAGAVLELGDTSLLVGAEWIERAAAAAIEREETKNAERNKREQAYREQQRAAQRGSLTSEQEREHARAERERLEAERELAHEANLELGLKTAKAFEGAEITLEVAQLLALLAVEHHASSLVARGVRYCDERFIAYDELKGGRVRRTYSSATSVNADGGRSAVDDLFGRIAEAKSPEQAIGAALEALVLARNADEVVVPESKRAYFTLPGSWGSGPLAKVPALLDAIAVTSGVLPERMRARIEERVAADEERVRAAEQRRAERLDSLAGHVVAAIKKHGGPATRSQIKDAAQVHLIGDDMNDGLAEALRRDLVVATGDGGYRCVNAEGGGS